MAALGASTVLLSSCGSNKNSKSLAPIYSELEKVVRSKQELISDATWLITSEPAVSIPLQVIVDQNLLHINALSPYVSSGASPSPKVVSEGINLPALAARCNVFSSNNLRLASEVPDAEISRVVALIAGSEMQHHILLAGYIV